VKQHQGKPAAPVDDWFEAVAEEPQWKPYRRHGDENWVPGSAPVESRLERAARHRREFAALRDQGLRVAEAARRLGICAATAVEYNAAYKQARAAGGAR
jgi:hypothetical protein